MCIIADNNRATPSRWLVGSSPPFIRLVLISKRIPGSARRISFTPRSSSSSGRQKEKNVFYISFSFVYSKLSVNITTWFLKRISLKRWFFSFWPRSPTITDRRRSRKGIHSTSVQFGLLIVHESGTGGHVTAPFSSYLFTFPLLSSHVSLNIDL